VIAFLLALAVGLFTLSLPIAKIGLGARLRQAAAICLVLALLPSIITGLFFSHIDAPAATPAPSWRGVDILSTLGCIAVLVLAALIAYGILKLRSRFVSKAKPRDPWEAFFNRGGGKRPFTINPRATRSRNPYAFDDEDDD
jgi:membrane protease YdiL (CAAX protease family)